MSNTKIRVEAMIAAPLKKVWNLWHDPKHITKWNFASNDWHCPTAENDLKIGGKLRSRMEAKDGSFGFDFEATYTELVDEQKITFEMTDGRVATTGFENVGDQTRVVTTFDAEDENSIDMQREGWQAILNNFKKYAESN